MTRDELRARYTVAYKIIQRERKWRLKVFGKNPELLESKLREMDRLLVIVTELKDEIKRGLDGEPVQVRLLDVPRRPSYE